MSYAENFFPVFEFDSNHQHYDKPIGHMAFCTNYEAGDLEPEFALRFHVMTEEGDLDFSVGEAQINKLLKAISLAKDEFNKEFADHLAGAPDPEETSQ